VRPLLQPVDEVSIAIAGKYVEYEDSYKSLKEALVHGAAGAQSEADRDLGSKREGLEGTGVRGAAARLRRDSGAGVDSASAGSKGC